jgi:heterodisulfide reductase subunit B
MAFVGAVPGSIEAKDDAFWHCGRMPLRVERRTIYEERRWEAEMIRDGKGKTNGNQRHEEEDMMAQSCFLTFLSATQTFHRVSSLGGHDLKNCSIDFFGERHLSLGPSLHETSITYNTCSGSNKL